MNEQELSQNISRMLRHFRYSHLPDHLQVVSREYHNLAWWTAKHMPDDPETIVALRKLLEAKDAAVRSAVTHEGGQ